MADIEINEEVARQVGLGSLSVFLQDAVGRGLRQVRRVNRAFVYPREIVDGNQMSVHLHQEIAAGEVADVAALRVRHDHIQVHDADFDGFPEPGAPRFGLRRQGRGKSRKQEYQSRLLHRFTVLPGATREGA